MKRTYNHSGYVIRISEAALTQLCLSGLEDYSVSHVSARTGQHLESYGMLWGHEVTLPNGKTFYSVEMATVDTSAKRRNGSVEPSDDALSLKRDVMTSFWPNWEFLGDFHTHPYETVSEVAEVGGHMFSQQDYDRIQNHSDYWRQHGYRVGLVLTIACLHRASSREHRRLGDGTLEFTLGNYRMWLKGYVAYSSKKKLTLTGHDDANVLLDCPGLLGLYQEYTPFGRGAVGPKPQHRAGAIDLSAGARLR